MGMKHKSVLPTKRQVVAALEAHIANHRAAAVLITGPQDIETWQHFIRCLEMALQVVRERKFPKGAGR